MSQDVLKYSRAIATIVLCVNFDDILKEKIIFDGQKNVARVFYSDFKSKYDASQVETLRKCFDSMATFTPSQIGTFHSCKSNPELLDFLSVHSLESATPLAELLALIDCHDDLVNKHSLWLIKVGLVALLYCMLDEDHTFAADYGAIVNIDEEGARSPKYQAVRTLAQLTKCSLLCQNAKSHGEDVLRISDAILEGQPQFCRGGHPTASTIEKYFILHREAQKLELKVSFGRDDLEAKYPDMFEQPLPLLTVEQTDKYFSSPTSPTGPITIQTMPLSSVGTDTFLETYLCAAAPFKPSVELDLLTSTADGWDNVNATGNEQNAESDEEQHEHIQAILDWELRQGSMLYL